MSPSHAPTRVPVLIHSFSGAIDAGHAGQTAASHLIDSLASERVATFDVDSLLDYRGRRPAMDFSDGAWTDYDEPQLVLDLLRDDEGVPVLLLHGAEPDVKWEAFIGSVMGLIDRFGVELTVGIHGIPMGVPHTRPLSVTAHATRPDLLADKPNFVGNVKVPGTAAGLLQYRLGQEGKDAIGFAVNVPHYLMQTEFPQAAAELVRQVSRATGLSLPVGDLEADGVDVLSEIQRQVDGSGELSELVRTLEENYDSFTATDDAPASLPGPASEIPTADDIAAQVEAFLAGQDDVD